MSTDPNHHRRSSGLLVHPTSLPGPYGIGDLASVPRFVDLLSEMRQSWWQMLPVGPTGYGNSPYQSPSTFAGNPLLIGLDLLVEDGLLDADEVERHATRPTGDVEFGAVIPARMRLLASLAAGFRTRADAATERAFEEFCEEHGPVWLDDFSLFTAIKRANDLRPWWKWGRGLAQRDPAALDAARTRLSDAIERVAIEQFVFDDHMARARSVAADHGIGLIGDIPIFVAHDSADVWANPELYHLDADGMPTVVAGVPPDYFSKTGQRWGNPLYDWDAHRDRGFSWWEARLARMFDLFDLVRVDHFRGFAASWHIPADEPTAVSGEWVDAPGEELFDTMLERFGRLNVIAEDLGLITPDVEDLRDRYGLPGMKVLQFGFGTESAHALEEFRPNVVAYTGTHDNDTARGWFESRPTEDPEEFETAVQQLGSTDETFAWDLVEAVMGSVANMAIIPMQDLLNLGSEARMNEPGTTADNWTWRFEWADVGADIVDRMAALTEESGRA